MKWPPSPDRHQSATASTPGQAPGGNPSLTIASALDATARRLNVDAARLEAEILLAHLLGKPRSYLFAWPEHSLDPATQDCFAALVQRRMQGEPVAYITGRREFWSLELMISPDVLIPRPETELIVETALAHLPATPCKVADLGTGSGAIALALAHERPAWRIIATDRSPAAIKLAQHNADRLELRTIAFHTGSWFKALPDNDYDLIVSNPPYIAPADPHLNQGDLRFEPRSALVSHDNGLRDIRQLTSLARNYLSPGGWLMLEHGCDQAEAVRSSLKIAKLEQIVTKHDLAGIPRATLGCKPAQKPGEYHDESPTATGAHRTPGTRDPA